MKFEYVETKTVDVKFLQVSANVRYWEDAKVNGEEDVKGEVPCREGENWCPLIEMDTGIILNWEKGKTASIHYKVCDAGHYKLLDAERNLVYLEDGYVPKIMCPAENGYGDYIIMNVDADGKIEDWDADLSDIEERAQEVD